MRELEGDSLIVAGTCRSLELHTQLLELDGQELDGHISVEGLGIGPALLTVAVSQTFVYLEEGI